MKNIIKVMALLVAIPQLSWAASECLYERDATFWKGDQNGNFNVEARRDGKKIVSISPTSSLINGNKFKDTKHKITYHQGKLREESGGIPYYELCIDKA